MYTYIYICFYLSVWTMSYFQFQSNIMQFILVFFLSIFLTPFSGSEKPGSNDPQYVYLFDQMY